MARYSLATYAIRVWSKDPDNRGWLQLGDFGDGDLLKVLRRGIKSLDAYSSDADKKVLRMPKLSIRGRHLEGIIETGEYGYESDLLDIDTGDVSYHRQVTEAEMLPFYYLFELPEDTNEGIVVLQRFQQFGIRGLFGKALINWFNGEYPAYRLSINPLVPREAWAPFFEDGHVRAVRFIRYDIPADITDAYDEGGHREEEGYMELVLRARRGQSLPLLDRLREAVSGRRDIHQVIEIPDFDYDDVKVEVSLGGSNRTVDLGKLHKTRSFFDITAQIEVGADGHPDFASVSSVARQLVADLRSSMGAT